MAAFIDRNIMAAERAMQCGAVRRRHGTEATLIEAKLVWWFEADSPRNRSARFLMAIPFVPGRGEILICDYDMARVHPEMSKPRRVVVISPRSYNERHGTGPGRCIVVPFTATCPRVMSPAIIHFPIGIYQTLTIETWACCDAVMALSHTRLNRVRVGGSNLHELMSATDMARIEVGIRHAVGIA